MSRDNEVSVQLRADLKKLRRDLAEAKREIKKVPEHLDVQTNLITKGLDAKVKSVMQQLKPLQNIKIQVDTSSLDSAVKKARKASTDINAALGKAAGRKVSGNHLGLGGSGTASGGIAGSITGMGIVDRAVVGGAAVGYGRNGGRAGGGIAGAITGMGPAGGGNATAGSRSVIAGAYERKLRAAARSEIEMVDVNVKDMKRQRLKTEREVAKTNRAQERLTNAIDKRTASEKKMVSRRGMTAKIRQGLPHSSSNAKSNAILNAMASNRVNRFAASNMNVSGLDSVPLGIHSPRSPMASSGSKAARTLKMMQLRQHGASAFEAHQQRLLAERVPARIAQSGGGMRGFASRFAGGFGRLGGGGGGGGRRRGGFMGSGGGGGTGAGGFTGASRFASGAIARGLYRSGAAGAIVGGAGALAVPAAGAAIGAKVLSDGVRREANIESTETNLRVLLKDGGAAKELISELKNMEQSTPVELTTLASNTQKLAASGYDAEEIPELLGTIMDAASVGVDTFENNAFRLTKALSQIKTNGRLLGEELLQLTDIGLPINEIVKEKFGMTSQELADASQAGEIEINTILDAITSGLKEKFGGALEEQSKTLAGQFNMLKKAYMQLSAEIATPVFDALTEFVTDLNKSIKDGEFESFLEGVKDALHATEEFGAFAKQVWENNYAFFRDLFGGAMLQAEMTKAFTGLIADMFGRMVGYDPNKSSGPSLRERREAAELQSSNNKLHSDLFRDLGAVKDRDTSLITDPEALSRAKQFNAANAVTRDRINAQSLAEQARQVRDGERVGPNGVSQKQKNKNYENRVAEVEELKRKEKIARLGIQGDDDVRNKVNQGKIAELQGGRRAAGPMGPGGKTASSIQGYIAAGEALLNEYQGADAERTKRIKQGQTASDADASMDKVRGKIRSLELDEGATDDLLKGLAGASGKSFEGLKNDLVGTDADRRMAKQAAESAFVGPATPTAAQKRKAQEDAAIREKGEKFKRTFEGNQKNGAMEAFIRKQLKAKGVDVDKFMKENEITVQGQANKDPDSKALGALSFSSKKKDIPGTGSVATAAFGDLNSLIQSKLDQSYEKMTAENTKRAAEALEELTKQSQEANSDKNKSKLEANF